MSRLDEIMAKVQAQNFGANDSMIVSSVNHPLEALKRAARFVKTNMDTAAGVADPYDNPYPWLAPSIEQQAEAANNISGLIQTGALPFAPKSAGGLLGTMASIKAKNAPKAAFAEAENLAKQSGLLKLPVGSDEWMAANKAIHGQTGIHYGADNMPRFEISDHAYDLAKPSDYRDAIGAAKQRILEINEQIKGLKESKKTPQTDLFPKELNAANKTRLAELQGLKKAEDYAINGNYGLQWGVNDVGMGTKAKYAYMHPELNAAYPERMNDIVVRTGDSGGNYNGMFDGNKLDINNWDDKPAARSTGIHEIQHAIQDHEGFGQGGNIGMMGVNEQAINDAKIIAARLRKGESPSDAAKWLSENMGRSPSPQTMDLAMGDFEKLHTMPATNYEAYSRLAGEAEARAVQARMNMTPEQRAASFPLDSYDVPIKDLIVRQRDNGPAMSLPKPTEFSQAHETARQNAVKMLGLPENNTAMDRARAMGFDVETPVYHGTNADFDAFDLNRSGSASGAEQYGSGVYTTTDPHTASGYANVNTDEGANVMPLLVNMKKPLDAATNKELTRAQVSSLIKQSPNLDDALSNYGDIGYEGRNKVLNEAVKSLHEWQDDNLLNNLHPIANDFYKGNNQAFNDAVAKTLKKDGVIVNQYSGEKFLIPFNPKQVRSRFAAFDPAKKDSANILANLLYGIPAAGYMLNQDKERKK